MPDVACIGNASPINITILLVVALAVIAIILLSKGRYDSNLPLLYYSAALTLTALTDRGLSPILLYTGMLMTENAFYPLFIIPHYRAE